MKALIVDDEPTARLLLSRILQREFGCDVAEATNGIEALDRLAREPVDFVVIDVMMPLMDGLETLEAIRATPALKHLPVMVLSAVRDEAQVRRLVALGVSAYLTKPLRALDATERFRRFLANLGTGAPDQPQAPRRTLVGLPLNSTILVVDGDTQFRAFVRDTLGDRYTVVEAEGGAQGLRACLASRPAAVLLGLQLGAVPPAMFLRKLRSLPHLAQVPVVVVGTRCPSVPLAYADALIQRTLVAETFLAQFYALIEGRSVEECALATRPKLRSHMVAAIEQVFGLMLGIEVATEPAEAATTPSGSDLTRVVIGLPHEEADVEFGIVTAPEMSDRMAALVRRGPVAGGGDQVTSALQEMARMIGSRLQNALRADGDQVTLQQATVERVRAEALVPGGWVAVSVKSAAGDLRFTGVLRSVSRPEATMPRMSAVAQA